MRKFLAVFIFLVFTVFLLHTNKAYELFDRYGVEHFHK
jgi:hypothetical protein